MSDPTKDVPLDPCGCCDGVSIDTPQEITNSPGLPAIRYRVGTHETFKSSMLARLATAELAPDSLLGAVASPAPAPQLRSGGDFQAALIDAFAVAADVVTFYQERIANESYLLTATERRSILELAREIGYELKPGVAAATTLQLITEEPPKVAPGATALAPQLREVPIDTGTRVQSVPGPGEKPQTFETIEDIVAYPEWNEIRPRLLQPVYAPANNVLWVQGKADVKNGETIVVHAKNDVVATIVDVAYDADADLTKVVFRTAAITGAVGAASVDGTRPYAFVKGGEGNLWVNWWSGSAWAWSNQGTPAGLEIAATLGTVAVDAGRAFTFVKASDGNLWLHSFNGTTGSWTNQGTPPSISIGSVIGSVNVSGNRPHLFVKGGDGNLWLLSWSGTTWSWTNQGRPTGVGITGAVGVTIADGTRPYAFVKGSDGNLWVHWWSGSAWGWANQGKPAASVDISTSVGAVTADGNRPFAFVKGSDGNLWVNWWSGSAWGWANQSRPPGLNIIGAAGAISVDGTRPYAFVTGSDANLWVNWWSGSAWAWANQGKPGAAGIANPVGAIVVDGGRPYVFVEGGDGNLWVNWWSGSAWAWANQNVPTFAAITPDPPVQKPGLTLAQLTAAKRGLGDTVVRESFESRAWPASDLRHIARVQGWALDELAEVIRRYGAAYAQSRLAFFTFVTKAAPFGHNAPAFDSVKGPNPATPFIIEDSEFNGMDLATQGGGQPGRVYLDGSYQDIAGSSVAVFWRSPGIDPKNVTRTLPELRRAYSVTRVGEASRASRSINAKVTAIDVEPNHDLTDFYVRGTAILAGSKRFDAFFAPVTVPLSGNQLELEGAFVRIEVGQKLIIRGERNDARGVFVSEVGVVKEVSIRGASTLVTLEKNLTWSYVRRTVTITANVAAATHGETVEEVLGNGDGSVAYQTFTLRQVPLTYVASAAAGGVSSTLRITVNDVIWNEVATLFGRGPRERVYVTRRGDDGKVTVQLGDGINGARLPTGQANVRAKYRKGIGLEGLVGPDKLTLLLSRPLGLKAATNPVAASDADDPEPRDEARANAPLTVLTLDRVVSLRDFEDFVRARVGVAKALASWMLGSERRGVFVTVAGPGGNPVANTAAIETSLRTSGDRFVPAKVRTFRKVFFRLAATVKVAPDRLPDVVAAAIESTLRETYAFECRAFGQPVHASEVVALIQSVPGVLSVNLTKLATDLQPKAPLTAAIPEGDLRTTENGAELLLLDPRPIELVVTT
ncbi:MAG TPA: hypothetical protein VNA69_09785 [Thermoanaerobaculia bacterium]|nr:hypothetical protein [Thermoanaerobaculia bacterium]